MIIRDALPNEYDKIRELRLQAYQEHSSKIPEEHWNALKQQIVTDDRSVSEIDVIVAELNGELVGTVVLFPAKVLGYQGLVEDELEYPELRKLAVSNNVRGKGIAKALVNECIKRSKEKGYTAMGLHTADFMESAVKLYENIGFVRVPELDFIPLDDGIVIKAFQIHF